MSEHEVQPLRRASFAWFVWVALALAAIGNGIYCFLEQDLHGDLVTGLANPGQGGNAWGLYITFVIFFIGVSFAGITIAALCRLFDIEALRPVSRLAELVTISALIAGASAVIADLGRPLHGLMNLPKYANPHSPFFGTFTLVCAGYLFSSVVYFFLAGRSDAAAMARRTRGLGRFVYRVWASGWRDAPESVARHHRVSFVLSLSILPLLVTAHSTLGFIFGIQSGRPGWYSALQAPGFVVMAGVSGTGMLILFAILMRRLFHLEEELPIASIRWLGNFLWVLALVYLYCMAVEELTATYAAPEADRHLAHQVVTGPFAPVFWTTVVCLFLAFLIPFFLYLRKRTSVGAVGIAAALANVAAILKRFLIVVPSQTHGSLAPIDEPHMYIPSKVELGLVGGLFGLVALLILLFVRVFPIVATPHDAAHVVLRREWKRLGATITTMIAAIALILVGLTDSFRLWSGDEIDPRIPFAPAIFAGGVILLFSSAIVYETFPARRRTTRPPRVSARAYIRSGRDHLIRRAP